ncbi:hypothetical protein QBC38DRAFT_531930 [Podospora fimiseda]|uniref:Rhodopsin domain-containing protein n=1 Tax=Podospora fimiseda TaxID=252190 RepID=A0AAN7BKH3_9PEZI|nr:hypothetical protein QBC38DRAFT_531930 [Podospora fimiseda]
MKRITVTSNFFDRGGGIIWWWGVIIMIMMMWFGMSVSAGTIVKKGGSLSADIAMSLAMDVRENVGMEWMNLSVPACSIHNDGGCTSEITPDAKAIVLHSRPDDSVVTGENNDSDLDTPCDYTTNPNCVCAIDPSGRDDFRYCVGNNCGIEGKYDIAMLEQGLCQLRPRSSKIYLWLPMLASGLAWFLLGVYFYCRWIITAHRYGPNDYLMMVLTVTFTVASTLMYVITKSSFGLDIWNVNTDEVSKGLKILYAGEPMYLLTITLAKLQLLTFYLETFKTTGDGLYFRMGLVFVILTNISLLAADLLQCIPISGNWTFVYSEEDPYFTSQPETCINVSAFILVAGGLNILQEVMIVALFSHPVLFSLPYPTRYRRFKVIAGVATLSFIIIVKRENNPSWDFVPALVCTNLEMSITVIVACAPALKAWTRRVGPDRLPQSRSVQEIIGPNGKPAVGRRASQAPTENRVSGVPVSEAGMSDAITAVATILTSSAPSSVQGQAGSEATISSSAESSAPTSRSVHGSRTVTFEDGV